MPEETFMIKSLFFQNAIMLMAMGVAFSLLLHSIQKKRPKHIMVFSFWVLMVIWFFNSPLFGFSVVKVSEKGIKIEYGILSIRDELLPLSSQWRVESTLSGIRKNKRLYFLTIGNHRSMKVRGEGDRRRLEEIGEAIERLRSVRLSFLINRLTWSLPQGLELVTHLVIPDHARGNGAQTGQDRLLTGR